MIKDPSCALPLGTILQGAHYQYKILKYLGQGAFGITYLASINLEKEGSDAVESYVAIKEFFMHEINGRDTTTVTCSSKDGLFGKYKEKFIKEAKALSSLKHPNIIKVIESFEAFNTVYYAMEYMEGGSLDNLIARKVRLPEKEALELAMQICSALQYMHASKMLHLDVKPSNAMIQGGNVKLIDFGLSKQYDAQGEPESSTSIGGGSPGYAPLEQMNFRDDLRHTMPVTMDIYALGATLFKMLTGAKPPVASEILNSGFPYFMLQQCGVSQATQRLVGALMTPIWKGRPQNMATVQGMIQQALTSAPYGQGEQTVVCDKGETRYAPYFSQPQHQAPNPSPLPYQTEKRKKSNSGILLGIIVFLVVLIGLGISFLRKPVQGSAEETTDSAAALYAATEEMAADTAPAQATGASKSAAEESSYESSGNSVRDAFASIATGNETVFTGSFGDSNNSWPIRLTFKGGKNPTKCVYYNVEYNVTVNMSVSFSSDQMILQGNAGGSNFVITLAPGYNDYWFGNAKNGKHNLTVEVMPD